MIADEASGSASTWSSAPQVTCIKWNPHYSDLCAVGFGSYDFMRQGNGVICVLAALRQGLATVALEGWGRSGDVYIGAF